MPTVPTRPAARSSLKPSPRTHPETNPGPAARVRRAAQALVTQATPGARPTDGQTFGEVLDAGPKTQFAHYAKLLEAYVELRAKNPTGWMSEPFAAYGPDTKRALRSAHHLSDKLAALKRPADKGLGHEVIRMLEAVLKAQTPVMATLLATTAYESLAELIYVKRLHGMDAEPFNYRRATPKDRRFEIRMLGKLTAEALRPGGLFSRGPTEKEKSHFAQLRSRLAEVAAPIKTAREVERARDQAKRGGLSLDQGTTALEQLNDTMDGWLQEVDDLFAADQHHLLAFYEEDLNHLLDFTSRLEIDAQAGRLRTPLRKEWRSVEREAGAPVLLRALLNILNPQRMLPLPEFANISMGQMAGMFAAHVAPIQLIQKPGGFLDWGPMRFSEHDKSHAEEASRQNYNETINEFLTTGHAKRVFARMPDLVDAPENVADRIHEVIHEAGFLDPWSFDEKSPGATGATRDEIRNLRHDVLHVK